MAAPPRGSDRRPCRSWCAPSRRCLPSAATRPLQSCSDGVRRVLRVREPVPLGQRLDHLHDGEPLVLIDLKDRKKRPPAPRGRSCSGSQEIGPHSFSSSASSGKPLRMPWMMSCRTTRSWPAPPGLPLWPVADPPGIYAAVVSPLPDSRRSVYDSTRRGAIQLGVGRILQPLGVPTTFVLLCSSHTGEADIRCKRPISGAEGISGAKPHLSPT